MRLQRQPAPRRQHPQQKRRALDVIVARAQNATVTGQIAGLPMDQVKVQEIALNSRTPIVTERHVKLEKQARPTTAAMVRCTASQAAAIKAIRANRADRVAAMIVLVKADARTVASAKNCAASRK